MTTRITATELARNLSDILNRVRYHRESFRIERNGETVAIVTPVETRHTRGELEKEFEGVKVPEGFADALEQIRKEIPPIPPPPEWPS
jgi:antitoxin (DNA-binding transcriptional repressor) of toxin-antitoxin stability system